MWRTGALFCACRRDMLSVTLRNFASRSSLSRYHHTVSATNRILLDILYAVMNNWKNSHLHHSFTTRNDQRLSNCCANIPKLDSKQVTSGIHQVIECQLEKESETNQTIGRVLQCVPKKVPLYTFWITLSKISQFQQFSVYRILRKLSSSCKFAHFAWKVSLHYLVKFRTIIVTSSLQNYDNKMF